MSRRDAPPQQQLERMVGDLKRTGMSCREIGREAGLSQSTVWRCGIGEARQPPHDTYVRIERVHEERCGVTPPASGRDPR